MQKYSPQQCIFNWRENLIGHKNISWFSIQVLGIVNKILWSTSHTYQIVEIFAIQSEK